MNQIPSHALHPNEHLSFDLEDLDSTNQKNLGFDQGYKRIKTNPPSSEEISVYECEKSAKDEPTPMQYENIRASGDLVERLFKLSHFQQKDIENIEKKANECGLFYEIVNDEIQVVGEQGIVFEFLSWLYDFLNLTLSGYKEDYRQDELSLSTFHRLHKEDILAKAEVMNIICEFKYHTVVITGLSKKLDMFKNYLADVEMSTKNPLYPQYWDFEDTEVYSEIKVLPGSNEFDEVLNKMKKSLYDVEILSLTRIQNNYLFSHYLTNLSMRQEVRRDSENTSRKLLFHGTRDAEPHKIYGNFDTGFDLQYAKESGLYGKGLYFAEKAQYSHGYAYQVKGGQNRYKMILADVFVGKPYESRSDRHLVKAPDGYDSVHHNGIHVIYNNFHSYPLYIIEYKTNQSTKYAPSLIQSFAPMPRMNNYTNAPQLTSLTIHPGASMTQNLLGSSNYNVIPIPNPRLKPAGLSPVALKRVQRELAELQKDADFQNFIIEIPDEKDLSKLNVIILGPENSYYEAGIFHIEVIFPIDYPNSPPGVTFKTQIYHPSVDKEGNICLGLLNTWNPVTTIGHVLLNLSALLHDPSLEEAFRPEIDFQYRNDKQGFITQARSWTRKYAT